jgi:hypothetical protein
MMKVAAHRLAATVVVVVCLIGSVQGKCYDESPGPCGQNGRCVPDPTLPGEFYCECNAYDRPTPRLSIASPPLLTRHVSARARSGWVGWGDLVTRPREDCGFHVVGLYVVWGVFVLVTALVTV